MKHLTDKEIEDNYAKQMAYDNLMKRSFPQQQGCYGTQSELNQLNRKYRIKEHLQPGCNFIPKFTVERWQIEAILFGCPAGSWVESGSFLHMKGAKALIDDLIKQDEEAARPKYKIHNYP